MGLGWLMGDRDCFEDGRVALTADLWNWSKRG